jgi:hypothetical protein
VGKLAVGVLSLGHQPLCREGPGNSSQVLLRLLWIGWENLLEHAPLIGRHGLVADETLRTDDDKNFTETIGKTS